MSALQQILLGYGEAGAPPPTYATWNPSDKAASISLSGGNLIASNGSFGAGIVRANIAISGKRYFECSFAPNGDGVGIGIATASEVLTNYLGQGTPSYGHYLPGNDVYRNGGAVYNGGSNSTTPVTVGVAVDGTKMWVRISGASGWEGGGDPAAGKSPTVTIAAGTYFPATTPYNKTHAVTLNAGQSSFVVWTPTGGFSGVS